jgi:hypothetical protein
MCQCAAEIYRLEERPRRRHADEVAGNVVVSLVATDSDIRGRSAYQLLYLRQDQAGINRRRASRDISGQALALVGVEYGEALQERDSARFLAPLVSAVAHVVRDEAIGIDDRCPALGRAHVPAQCLRLLEGEPALHGEAPLHHCVPEDEE